MTDMERFSVFLRYAENPDYREIVNKVIESREGLAVAGELLMSISKDERERAIFRNRRIAVADRESNMAQAILNERDKWQGVVAEKDTALAAQAARIAELEAQLGNK